jgi:hypothetical protein
MRALRTATMMAAMAAVLVGPGVTVASATSLGSGSATAPAHRSPASAAITCRSGYIVAFGQCVPDPGL